MKRRLFRIRFFVRKIGNLNRFIAKGTKIPWFLGTKLRNVKHIGWSDWIVIPSFHIFIRFHFIRLRLLRVSILVCFSATCCKIVILWERFIRDFDYWNFSILRFFFWIKPVFCLIRSRKFGSGIIGDGSNMLYHVKTIVSALKGFGCLNS